MITFQVSRSRKQRPHRLRHGVLKTYRQYTLGQRFERWGPGYPSHLSLGWDWDGSDWSPMATQPPHIPQGISASSNHKHYQGNGVVTRKYLA